MNVFQKLNNSVAIIAELAVISNIVAILSRVLLAIVFIVSGYGKITGYDATIGYMESMGVSGALLPLVIIAELGGGLALVVGFQARIAAIGLAIFCVVTAIVFHSANDMNQQIHFMKNLAIAGGLLMIFLNGPGGLSVDNEHKDK